jgi:Mg/Co/Ni transporter MgtE
MNYHLGNREDQRRMASGGSVDPMQLRQRMIDDRDSEPEISDVDCLLALYRMDREDQWQALHLLSNRQCRRVVRMIEEDNEFQERVLDQVSDEAALLILSQLSDAERWRALCRMPDDTIIRMFGSD